jgi:hypothetical protein
LYWFFEIIQPGKLQIAHPEFVQDCKFYAGSSKVAQLKALPSAEFIFWNRLPF